MTVANSGFGMGNGQAYPQLLGLGIGMKNSILNFCDWKRDLKKNGFKLLGLGMGMKTMSPTQLEKNCQTSDRKKIGNGNFHLCLQCWYFTTRHLFLNSLLHIADLTPYNSSLIVVNLIIGSEKWCIEKKKVPNNFFLKF